VLTTCIWFPHPERAILHHLSQLRIIRTSSDRQAAEVYAEKPETTDQADNEVHGAGLRIPTILHSLTPSKSTMP
jgi:hypothetical protein